MNKRKIVIFHKALAPYRVDFFNHLARNFDASFYFFLDNLKDQKFDQNALRKETHFQFNLLKAAFEFKDRSFHFGVFNIIKKEKPDIVLCSEYSQVTISVLVYKSLFNRRLKVYTISDDSIHMSEQRKNIRRWLRNIVSYFIDGVVFPSEAVCDWYSSNVNSKTKTLELPIIHDNVVFREKLNSALKLSESNIVKHSLAGKKIFLFTGRLVKLKNVDTLLKAFADVDESLKMLIIIGEGEEIKPIKLLTAELHLDDYCIFTGRLEGEELLAWFNIAHCLVLPSYQEAYGAVVNESLLAGCKVLCSNYAGASVLINEKNGHTFDPKDKKHLTELIRETAHELRPVELSLKLRSDLMPFTLKEKLKALFTQL